MVLRNNWRRESLEKKNIRETNRKGLFRWWVYAGAKNAVNGMFMHEEYSSYARQHSKIVGLFGGSRSATDCCEMFHRLLPLRERMYRGSGKDKSERKDEGLDCYKTKTRIRRKHSLSL